MANLTTAACKTHLKTQLRDSFEKARFRLLSDSRQISRPQSAGARQPARIAVLKRQR
jgi:hypothetical protein